jgi:hypothetical protein
MCVPSGDHARYVWDRSSSVNLTGFEPLRSDRKISESKLNSDTKRIRSTVGVGTCASVGVGTSCGVGSRVGVGVLAARDVPHPSNNNAVDINPSKCTSDLFLFIGMPLSRNRLLGDPVMRLDVHLMPGRHGNLNPSSNPYSNESRR